MCPSHIPTFSMYCDCILLDDHAELLKSQLSSLPKEINTCLLLAETAESDSIIHPYLHVAIHPDYRNNKYVKIAMQTIHKSPIPILQRILVSVLKNLVIGCARISLG